MTQSLGSAPAGGFLLYVEELGGVVPEHVFDLRVGELIYAYFFKNG